MIQEQISTSSPKCLDGNAGFGVVAQTAGMAPNVARDVGMLSGYSHLFPAGDSKNPVAFLHALRRSGGTDRHVISRVADCGNDYSGRTNRIGHHWIVEESDLPSLPAGPAAIASQPDLFCVKWNEKSQELPRGKKLPNPSVAPAACRTWQQRFGDAGWGGVVAERIEKGDPISIIFEPGTNPLPLLAEAFALLPPAVRWKTTFSTFFMKSQEPPGAAKIQVKCIVVGSDEMAFARLTPNTLLLDLRNPPTEAPSGKYVEMARTGRTEMSKPVGTPGKMGPLTTGDANPVSGVEKEDVFELVSPSEVPHSRTAQIPMGRQENGLRKKKAGAGFPWLLVLLIAFSVLLFSVVGVTAFLNRDAIAKRISKNDEVETGAAAEDLTSDPPKSTETESPAPADPPKSDKPESSAPADPPKPDMPESSATESGPAKPAEPERSAVTPDPPKTDKPGSSALTPDPAKPDKPESSVADSGPKEPTEAEKKAEAEKAEKERKAAEEEAAKKEAERKRKEVEAKIAAEKAKIDALPDFWPDIALPRPTGLVHTHLGEKSKFLWGIRKRIKLDLVPFVDLKGEWSKLDKPIKIDKEEHKIVFAEITQNAFGDSIPRPLLSFELKESGLSYEWSTPPNYNSTELYRKLNRFLLSKLRIEIDGKTAKEIALWSPITYNFEQYQKALDAGDGYFALWKPPDGKEFVIFSEDKSPMLLDFNEVKRGDDKFPVVVPKTFLESSFCYAPKIPPIDGEEGVFTATSRKEKNETLKVKVGFIPGKLNDLQQQAKGIEEQIETLKRFKGKDKRKTERERDTKRNQLTKLERGRAGDLEIQNLRTEIQNLDMILSQQKQLEDKIKNLSAEYIAKEKELREETKKWGNVKVEAFSICLLKPGTTATDADKPENRLPLFQIVTP